MAAFIFLLDLVALDTIDISSCSVVGYATSPALHTLRSGNIPYELVIVHVELFDEHWIGSSGGVEFASEISRKKRRCRNVCDTMVEEYLSEIKTWLVEIV